MSAQELRLQIKKMIIETLKIAEVQPEQIDDKEMIFESKLLNLDSLDGLELVIGIQKEFDVKINDQSHALTILQTVNSIAEFIESHQNQ
ncbi:MAG: acyl carrier protein [Syntrophobacterales bacterium]|nr:phosphopantetheine-binding protein [Desulfobulbaceae bacterium]TFG93090.1 MAG: acyl carrier protein [Syntrophobacterales bacterium]